MALKKKYNPLVKLGFDLYNEVEIPDLTNYFYNRYSTGDKLPIIVEHDMGGIKMQDINCNSFLYVGDNGNLNIGGTSTLIKSGHKHSEYDVYKSEICLYGTDATFKQNGILYLNVQMYSDGVGFVEIPGVFKSSVGYEEMVGPVRNLLYKQANGNSLIYSSTMPHFENRLTYYNVDGTPLISSYETGVLFMIANDNKPFLKREGNYTIISDGGEGEISLISGVSSSSFIKINAADEGVIMSPMQLQISSNNICIGNPYGYDRASLCFNNGNIYIYSQEKEILMRDNNGFRIGDQTTPNVDAIYLSAAGIAHLKAQLGLA